VSGSLVFHHQDGDLLFDVVDGVYNLSPSGIFSCSIACQRNEAVNYMAAPHFAFLHVPVGGALSVGQVLAVDSPATAEANDQRHPLVHLYAGQHFSPWSARLVVKAVTGHAIRVHGSFVTQDPNYYDARARHTAAEFSASLRAVPPSEVWNPL
jgi:hypothetical protein